MQRAWFVNVPSWFSNTVSLDCDTAILVSNYSMYCFHLHQAIRSFVAKATNQSQWRGEFNDANRSRVGGALGKSVRSTD